MDSDPTMFSSDDDPFPALAPPPQTAEAWWARYGTHFLRCAERLARDIEDCSDQAYIRETLECVAHIVNEVMRRQEGQNY
jgi:hypothetical protein